MNNEAEGTKASRIGGELFRSRIIVSNRSIWQTFLQKANLLFLNYIKNKENASLRQKRNFLKLRIKCLLISVHSINYRTSTVVMTSQYFAFWLKENHYTRLHKYRL